MYSDQGMHIFDVNKNLTWKVSSAEDHASGVYRYPGFLKDGRLAYHTCRRDERTCGVMFIDPYQVEGAPEHACITEGTVVAAKASFSTK